MSSPLRPDAAGLLDLPPGFKSRVISQFGERMDNGLRVPDEFAGMGSIQLSASRVALVCNHELHGRTSTREPSGVQPARQALSSWSDYIVRY